MAPLFRTKCAADAAVIEPDAARAPDPTACRVLGASLYFSVSGVEVKGIARNSF